jgi:NadR type nicotinamide-nucleotide adenylyltransferase
MTTALVIGKFYPPHAGHLALIARAAQHDHAVVLVLAATVESIALADRVEWIRAATSGLSNVTVIGALDDAPVDYDSSVAWTAHAALIRAALRHHGLPTPDVVVSSEPYGDHLAEQLGAVPELFDPARSGIRVSGTAVRADLAGHWSTLPEPVRLGLATRIIVLGAESTGSTTLADDLRAHFSARPCHESMRRVEEYGRHFTYELYREAWDAATEAGLPKPNVDDIVWTTDHFRHIGEQQTRWENEAALANPLVIADTDAFATTVWERRYVGPDSHGARRAGTVDLPRRDLYLVTDHVGVPFEQDGWRDGEHLRAQMQEWFIDALTAAGHSWLLLRGSRAERLDYAIRAVEGAWSRRTTFASPEWADVTVLA